ncbi:tyrosine-type recombinase/integrase [Nocardia fluminea]|uniref:tyrosine-type recombinase/integrase n=1 Tax=Nocardia fluminea TaxID=134984 RepID=UPI003668F2F6
MSRSTEGWIQKRTRTSKSGKVSVKYIGRIKPAGMEEIYSTPYDRKGTNKEFGTAAYWLAEQRQLLRTGYAIDPRTRKWTVYEWTEHWHNSPTREVAQNTNNIYDAMLKADLKDTEFGSMLITDVEDTDVAGWLRAMHTNRHWMNGRNLALSTVNTRRAMIGAVFAGAVEKKVITHNPVKGVKRLREAPRTVPLDPKEIPTRQAVWDLYECAGKLDSPLQEAILIAAGTGLRLGELFGMEESQLTRNKRGRVTEIYVSRQLKLEQPGIQFGRLKTDQSYRRIPVGEMVADAIDRHLARYPLDPSQPNGTVILRYIHGQPWTKGNQWKKWNLIRTAYGDPTMIWYHFRHFYISGQIEGGGSPKMVMERAGHSSPDYTLTRYARLWQDADEQSARLSDNALRRDINGTPPAH